MSQTLFDSFFQGKPRDFLLRAVSTALEEDGPDLTSLALFAQGERLVAEGVAKERLVIAGLPVIPLVLAALADAAPEDFDLRMAVHDGDEVEPGTRLFLLEGPAAPLLKAERIILNFLCHLSGIATLTKHYAAQLKGSRTRLLDTRKTLPGLRHAEKYAVRVGGGLNHRMDLAEMLMLKDTHLDRAGSITGAVAMLRAAYSPCPPIEVECRTLDEVREAVACEAQRIMLDNMDMPTMAEALGLVPSGIETEISGGVSFDRLGELATLGADFVSVGRLTHSAPTADISLRVVRGKAKHEDPAS
ncbi:nicotinate-nucleotide pyrophosphorylase [Desulfovibrio sp. X2]|uniref:carboxylating nicotinate-nucleotide diphosphorylase n=1 Tax=Desulfovibrio sp. X2 TaxID=941449 RepID=UPI000358AAFD|nr:carboxylating nicotinate-nucleotide diphosphorylase [Desulfovibrio sp. X2]EPR42255.1 nicotinate-nucleotide pyrophosphorylase [Desulfovibrio sp. X2]